ncbi:MAG: lysoplasmalogenase [Caldilineales bacterium]
MTTAETRYARISTRTLVLIAIGLVAGLAYLLAGRLGDSALLRLVAKPVPVLCLALWVSFLPRRGRYQGAVAAGLLLCALGDILLEAADATFLLGLVAFLLGHVAYVVAFTRDSRRLFLPGAVLAYGYGVLVYAYLTTAGDLGALAVPVLVYMLVICTMLWRASARVGVPSIVRSSALAGLAGALFFTASDSILALRMFGTPVDLGGITVMLTYWVGQLLIAFSARDASPTR